MSLCDTRKAMKMGATNVEKRSLKTKHLAPIFRAELKTSFLRRRRRLPDLLLLSFLRQDIAVVDPAFHADHAVSSPRFRHPEVDVGPQGVQGETALQIPLGARNFGAVQSPAAAHLDPLAAEPQRGVDRLAHGAAEGHAFLQL